MKHVMIDLETFGTSNDAAIVSIGAVLFDPNQGIVDEERGFHAKIDMRSKDLGKIDPPTVMWWLSQSDEARAALTDVENTSKLGDALQQLNVWLNVNGFRPEDKRDWNLWANDPDFDVIILESAYRRQGVEYPFSYSSSRSMRTMSRLAGWLDLKRIPVENTLKHDALADAIYQAKVVTAIMQELRKRIL